MNRQMRTAKNYMVWIGLLISLMLALSGCLPKTTPQPTSPPATPTPTSEEVEGEAEALIKLAKADLSQREGLDISDITVQSVNEKVFSDASLGVPEPGKSYAQVQTPGYIIVLKAEGETYEYHGAESRVVAVPEEEPTPEASAEDYMTITIPSRGLLFEIPSAWQKVEGVQAWTPKGRQEVYLGFHTKAIEPPAEVESVMMPSEMAPSQQSINQGREEISTNQGPAYRYTIQLVESGGDGGSEIGLETHVITMKTEEDVKQAYDFYLGAPDSATLEQFLPVLGHALDTFQFAEKKTVTIYFNNTELNPDAECDQVFPVEREISSEKDPLRAALEELFQGPSPAEAEEGYTSFFSEETEDILIDVKVEGNTAYLNLQDIRGLIPGVSSSCGSQEFFAEVEQTIKAQKPSVEKVLYAIEGDPEPFYEWVQLGCQEFNDFCDPAPFQDMNP
ncbi:MAG: GerMN domain-containing protein [Anaerolineales bacterium]